MHMQWSCHKMLKNPESQHCASRNRAKLERQKIGKLNSQGTQGISNSMMCAAGLRRSALPRGTAEPGMEHKGKRESEQSNRHCCNRNSSLASNLETCILQFFPIEFLQQLYNWLEVVWFKKKTRTQQKTQPHTNYTNSHKWIWDH